MYGIHARSAVLASTGAGSAVDCAPMLRTSGTPPNPRIVFGRQTFVNANSIQNDTSAPVMSGKYGPRNTATGHWPAMYDSEPTIASGHASRTPSAPLTR